MSRAALPHFPPEASPAPSEGPEALVLAHDSAVRAVGSAARDLVRALTAAGRAHAALAEAGVKVPALGVDSEAVVATILRLSHATAQHLAGRPPRSFGGA